MFDGKARVRVTGKFGVAGCEFSVNKPSAGLIRGAHTLKIQSGRSKLD
jgi:hypothetical protein